MKKTILITGSSSGLGYQLAKELSRSYRIIGCGRKILKCKFQNYYQIDLNNLKEVEEWIEEITKKLEKLKLKDKLGLVTKEKQ